ncbi:MAG: 4Fe-4S dicluster domain-containing protein [Oscillospiraceae bacterium]|nr:4Fe-4S dicluster domain-containing protein [Oscillospiraceae bacterium]
MTDKLFNYLDSLGVDVKGVGDLRSFDDSLRASLPFGISFGIAIDKDIVRRIPDGPFMDYVDAYTNITDRLDDISHLVTNFIIESGYIAIAQDRTYVNEQISASKNDTDNLYGKAYMPHKTVAASAGLGWITKSALLINDRYGSAVRYSSVLTDAPLDAYVGRYDCRCNDCNICSENCPTGAIYSRVWTSETSREELFDYELCQKSFRDRGKLINVHTGGGTCGICIAVCPHTKKYLNS